MTGYMQEQNQADVRYVTPVRLHAYDTSGRYHTEAQSQLIRGELLTSLCTHFNIQPVVLDSQSSRQSFADALVAEVFQNRQPVPTVLSTRRRHP